MDEVIKQCVILWGICKDGKIETKEVPTFINACVSLVAAVAALIIPSLHGKAQTLTKGVLYGASVSQAELKNKGNG